MNRQGLLDKSGISSAGRLPEFDELARLVSAACVAPVTVVAFLGDEYAHISGAAGADGVRVPLEASLAAKVLDTGTVAVRDLASDRRFAGREKLGAVSVTASLWALTARPA